MKRILVVDNEKSTVYGLKVLMSEKDIAILIAVDAKSAIEILSECTIDLLLTDIRLSTNSKTEGLSIVEFIKGHCPNTKVIVMTGYGTPAIQEKAIELGADFYFEKPIELDILGQAVGELLFSSDQPA